MYESKCVQIPLANSGPKTGYFAQICKSASDKGLKGEANNAAQM